MIVFPMRGAHAGDLVMALPAIGAAMAWGPVTVAGLAPRYYSPFRRLPVTFLYAEPEGHVLRPNRVRGKHQTDTWLESLPQPARPIRLDIPLFGTDSAAAMLPGSDWVLLSPWSDFAPKRWTVEGWRAVAALAQQLGYRVAVTGPPQSIELCGSIASAGCTNLAGEDTLDNWPAVLARASVVVSTDSATGHVADALGIPVIGLYGYTRLAEFGPYWEREYCVSADGMDAIGPDAVMDALQRWHGMPFSNRNKISTKP